MQAPDPIETILARLMPPALSQDAQFEMDAMIDELAGPEAENVVGISSGRWLVRAVIGGGIAAAFGAMFAIFSLSSGSRVAAILPMPVASGLVLISESDRIESMTDEGWQENSDGLAMRAHGFKADRAAINRIEMTGIHLQHEVEGFERRFQLEQPHEAEALTAPGVEVARIESDGTAVIAERIDKLVALLV